VGDIARRFTGRDIWIDLIHGGNASAEEIRLARCLWSGPGPTDMNAGERDSARATMAPPTGPGGLGDYRCCLVDDDGASMVEVPFGSIFAEWMTTAEAKVSRRSFVESFLVPQPVERVRLRVDRRGESGQFEAMHEEWLDPANLQPAEGLPDRQVRDLAVTGPSDRRVDLLFAAEGYGAGDAEQFFQTCQRLSEELFAVEPYRTLSHRFNVRGVFAPSPDQGISDGGASLTRRTVVGATYGALGLDRYVLPFDDAGIRRLIDGVPCSTLIIACNTEKYGGGGVFNRFAILAANNPRIRYLLLHEFGHSFAGLGDEYYAATVPYETSSVITEPWHPNVSALLDGTPKWNHLVAADMPLPSPWGKADYEALVVGGAMSADQMRAQAEAQAKMLASEPLFGRVGAFEGALYRAHRMYRPEVQCMMFNSCAATFCRVCRDAIEKRIFELSGVDETAGQASVLRRTGSVS
jgi:hypothetical protein